MDACRISVIRRLCRRGDNRFAIGDIFALQKWGCALRAWVIIK